MTQRANQPIVVALVAVLALCAGVVGVAGGAWEPAGQHVVAENQGPTVGSR